jgi:hypothetical protein
MEIQYFPTSRVSQKRNRKGGKGEGGKVGKWESRSVAKDTTCGGSGRGCDEAREEESEVERTGGVRGVRGSVAVRLSVETPLTHVRA